MRKTVLTAAILALCACSQQGEEATAETETAEPANAEPATAALSGDDVEGDYSVTWADGSVTTTRINADGTFADTADGAETSRGTWEIRDNRTCFTPEGGAELCWTDSAPAEDGSWVATAEDGTTVTVMRQTAESGA
ncbi:hypothetical protein [Pelagerythrobacter marensis]|uniref:Lipoprotein n=1 Tax=Pelagerythrobacter marensis TaxID=543877 RepID=A0A0G3X754_9SPHN|nr:hypothetical protein [Pelagerythrobacter marensis]AKM07385.1 hypothetical protein AM2010_1312 [Pelagerythrobacter marensis]